ncbi:MAG: hypothetical protein ACJAQT_003255 [Akkermansiaceae bacterium]|jgi:hypothetical protein
MKSHLLMRWFLLTLGLLSLQNLGAQEIEVFRGTTTGTNLTDNSAPSFNMGSTPVAGGMKTQLFTIRNTSATALTGISVAGTAEFTINAQPAATLAQNLTTTFTVTFNPSGSGQRDGTISVTSNDADENPFEIKLRGTGQVPEIEVFVGSTAGTNLTDNATSRTVLDATPVNGGTSTRNFVIKNSGDADLTGLAVTSNSGDFTISQQPAATLAADGESTFTVVFNPSARGTRTGTISIANSDSNEAPFEIRLEGLGQAPEISIASLGGAISSQGTLDFGPHFPGEPEKRTLTITNSGDMNLSGLSGVTIDSPSNEFAIETSPANSIGALSFDDLVITFTPSSAGPKTATLTIPNDDPDGAESPFVINLRGTGETPALGSDNFGYKSTTGTPANGLSLDPTEDGVVTLASLSGDDTSQAVNIGFPFSFYDQVYTSLSASTNGLLVFGDRSSAYSPASISSTGFPNNYIAAFWTDLFKRDTVSTILYATRGSTPNRVFVIEYNDMQEFSNTAARVSFQVLLYEGSNAIEIQFKKVEGLSGDRNITVGIEGPRGETGIAHVNQSRTPPRAQSAVTFTRPVVVDIESKYTRPGSPLEFDLGNMALGLDPEIGTLKLGYETVKRFEAPEYIFLNRNFAPLPAVGDLDPADPDDVAWYRLVNDGYAIDGKVVQGTQTFFTTTLTKDVTVVWRWKLEFAVIIDSATGGGGFGNPMPEIGRSWYELGQQVTAAIDSSVRDPLRGFRFRSSGYSIFDENGGSVLANGAFDPDADRQAIIPFTITGPSRIKWNWTGQVLYQFDAALEEVGGGFVADQAFVKVYDTAGSAVDTSLGQNGFYWSGGANEEVWIDSGTTGRKVEVGIFYRSKDRCLTLKNFNITPEGDLASLGLSVNGLSDQFETDLSGDVRLARVFTVDRVENPTNVHWKYGATVFRAIIPLGQSFDPVNANLQLVPNLCAGGVLSLNGPDDATIVLGPPDGSTNKTPEPLRWDTLGKRLFPVHPGSYKVSWPDEQSDQIFEIEIVSGFPDGSAQLSSPEETEEGLRKRNITLNNCILDPLSDSVECGDTTGLLSGMSVSGEGILVGTTVASVTNSTKFSLSQRPSRASSNVGLGAGPFQSQATLEGIDPDDGFPAAANGAHYRHLFTTAERRPPTKLDLNQTDQWDFQAMTYAETTTGATAVDSTETVPFNTTGAGRTVLLYSFRPNPDEIADGTLEEENLAVRIVRSEEVRSILRSDPRYVLGKRGLTLGHGTSANDGAVAMVGQAAGAPASFDPGNHYVIDLWLNARGLMLPKTKGLSSCTTTEGSTTVECSSTANLKVGMDVSGPFIPPGATVQSLTAVAFVMSGPATGTGTELSLSAIDFRPVTVFSSGESDLKVTLDARAETISASFGDEAIVVTHGLPRSGTSWRHLTLHLFEDSFFNSPITILDFYLDGIRLERGAQGHLLTAAAPIEIGASVSQEGLSFGKGVDPAGDVQIDQFRLFKLTDRNNNNPYLNPGEVRQLRTSSTLPLRQVAPSLAFGFEVAPVNDLFENTNASVKVGIQALSSDEATLLAGIWARLDIEEVATRLDSTLDNAGFAGSGYILNEVSNYNPNLYTRDAEVGFWGPIFPVNDRQLFTAPDRRLEVAYYENPFLTDPLLNPNVAWPYISAGIDSVIYPSFGPHRDKAIYIASRIGSEGVDQNGRLQEVYDLANYAALELYQQDSLAQAGYNPNEEHALIAPSGRAALKLKNLGADVPNNPPPAAFALQENINATSAQFTSEPWVLVQVDNVLTGEPEMSAYRVFETRAGAVSFPRPADVTDRDDPANTYLGVDEIVGLAYESAPNLEDRFLTLDPEETFDFNYQFVFPVFAGDLLIPPYPLNIVVGNVPVPETRGGNMLTDGVAQSTYWKDVNNASWVVSGNGTFFQQFFYPRRPDFFLPGTAIGSPVPWVPVDQSGNHVFTGDSDALQPGRVIYSSAWRSDYPKLKRGETLTYQGGEYFAETPGANGLPKLVAMAAAEIVYDDATKDMVFETQADLDRYSARIVRPLDRIETPFTIAEMGAAGFSPAAPSIFVVAERWYFKDLPGSLQRRFYFDSLAQKLVFRGYLNDKDSGDPDLTSGPDPLNILEPNIVTSSDRAKMAANGSGTGWTEAVTTIYETSQNPSMVRKDVTGYPKIVDEFLPGVKESPTYVQRIGLNLELLGLEANIAKIQAELDEAARKKAEASLFWSAFSAIPNGSIYAASYINQFGLSQFSLESIAANTIEATAAGVTKAELDAQVSTLQARITALENQKVSNFSHLDSFGVGSALVCNPDLLTAPTDKVRYVTIVENNRTELAGAPISLHIIEIIPDRYRGAIKVIEPADAFSERITLQHNGEFGANTGDLYYEWWIRDTAPLNLALKAEIDSLSTARPDADWQQYLPEPAAPKTPAELTALGVTAEEAKHLGLHTIVFEGRPDVTLADKLVMVRYRHRTEDNWKLVPFEVADSAIAWKPGNLPPVRPAPFQWAGAANSPQAQADGSKRYVPQLVPGWVKRVLDRINPYEARYNDFFSNESPAIYSSQIQIAGAPFAGKVALNSDKNVIENTGLIELYETVLARARELSIDNSSNGNASDGIQQALLLAATRLSTLYELLAREAYSDAQDPTITVGGSGDLASVTSFTHAFQNMEADLQHEELALLRGTDFLKSYPVYNRIFWNYAKGLGEAAYNVNYNIYDVNTDGFINESDARALYPQGHGDAWGHFSSSLGMSYTLLQSPGFRWNARSELYSLLQNVLEVDFLDEKTFAQQAAGKARAGRDIVRGTYRLAYTQDPDGQWQGYTDNADKARAWGVSEWAHRAGQGAYLDWVVANSLLPESADLDPDSPIEDPENLDRLERAAAAAEIGEIAGGLHEIQMAMDEANGGVNPLGFDSDALVFDLNAKLYENGSGSRLSHFEQIHGRAVVAGKNALSTLSFAAKAENKLRHIADDTDSLIAEALSQDLDYRNRLIEIFGRPYDGTIGFGKAYPEGYEGPDTQLFAYLDKINISDIATPPEGPEGTPSNTVTFTTVYNRIPGIMDNGVLNGVYTDLYGDDTGKERLKNALETLVGDNNYLFEPLDPDGSGPLEAPTLTAPYNTASKYGFVAPDGWGGRTSYGQLQGLLEQMLIDEIVLDTAIGDYIGYLQDWELKVQRLRSELEIYEKTEGTTDTIEQIRITVNAVILAADTAIGAFEAFENFVGGTADAINEAAKTGVVGLASDVLAPVRGAAAAASAAAGGTFNALKSVKEIVQRFAEFGRDEAIAQLERNFTRADKISALEGHIEEIANLSGGDQPGRNAIALALQNLEIHRQQYFTAQAKGFRLLREREAFNKILAAKVQSNRYDDMIFRLTRNEAMTKYQAAFNHAARYTWLAARAYDYETSLDPGDPAAIGGLLDQIVKERQLGLWSGGTPRAGQGGLAEILNKLSGNFQVLKGQLGIDSQEAELEKMSLRQELFRVGPGGNASSDDRWKDVLKARIVPDLRQMPEFVRHCRPFSTDEEGPQPGLVIRFSSTIENGKNFFGNTLASGDHAYSTANFANKIRGFGVWMENYNEAGLSTTPRAYLVPIGNDYLRTSSSTGPSIRSWSILEQRIPTPFVINEGSISAPGYIPTLNGVDGGFGQLRRHGDFRVYHDEGDDTANDDELQLSTRLISRSVWNSDWMLVIPGAGLDADPMNGLNKLAETIGDIRLQFSTYSHQGQ